ncbi:hypothetical protein KO465_03395 [Candidatus Micrarchaeota archaeon]|nr:hypothetical protein [Candidatus Micrarchaeota archaeon]
MKKISAIILVLILCVNAYEISKAYETKKFSSCGTVDHDSYFNSKIHILLDYNMYTDKMIQITGDYPSGVSDGVFGEDGVYYICPSVISGEMRDMGSSFYEFDGVLALYGGNCPNWPVYDESSSDGRGIIHYAELHKCLDGIGIGESCRSGGYNYPTFCTGGLSYSQHFDHVLVYITPEGETFQNIESKVNVACDGGIDVDDSGTVTENWRLRHLVSDPSNVIADWTLPSNRGPHDLRISSNPSCEGMAYHMEECIISRIQRFTKDSLGEFVIFDGDIYVQDLVMRANILGVYIEGETAPATSISLNPDGTPTNIRLRVGNLGPMMGESDIEMGLPLRVMNVRITREDCYDFVVTTPLPYGPINPGSTGEIEGQLSTDPAAITVCDDAPIEFELFFEGSVVDCSLTYPQETNITDIGRTNLPDYICDITADGDLYTLGVGESTNVYIDTINIGSDATKESRTDFVISPGSNYNYIIPGLRAGAQFRSPPQTVRCDPGVVEIEIWGVVNADDGIIESNRNNNNCNQTITCSGAPDYIADCSVVGSSTVNVGENVTYNIITKNTGLVDAIEWSNTTVRLGGNGPFQGITLHEYGVRPLNGIRYVFGLPVPGMDAQTFEIECTAPGTMIIRPGADYVPGNPNGVIIEDDENNNWGNVCEIICLGNYTCIDFI